MADRRAGRGNVLLKAAMFKRQTLVAALGGFIVGVVSTLFVGYWFWLRSPALVEARRAYDDGQYQLALNLAKLRLQESKGGDLNALRLAGRSAAKLGRWDEAERFFAQVPIESIDDLHLRARGLVESNRYPEAAQIYEQILQQSPSDGPAIQYLATIRNEQNRSEDAVALARRLIDIPSHQVLGWVMTGMFERHLRRYPQAAEALEQALKLSPSLEKLPIQKQIVLQWLAECYVFLGKGEKAEFYASQANDLSPSAHTCYLVGMGKNLQGAEEEAIKWWQKAISLDSNHSMALRELGHAALGKRQSEQALDYFERAYRLDPRDPSTVNGLVATYRRLGRHKDADALPKPTEVAPLEQIPPSSQ